MAPDVRAYRRQQLDRPTSSIENCERAGLETGAEFVQQPGMSQASKHWHGATPTTAATHIAIQESLNGKSVEWLEKVSDDQ